MAVAAAAPGAVQAKAPTEAQLERTYSKLYTKVERVTGDKPGRHIVKDGIRKNGRGREASKADLKRSIKRLRYILRSATAPKPAASPEASQTQSRQAPAQGGSSAGAGLESIAACESGGDPSAVSANGKYRGKYQFDQQTWQSVGGSGDPAAASEAEQDRRAAALVAQRGTSPFPVCGG